MLSGALGSFLKNMDIGALRLAQAAVRNKGAAGFGRTLGGWFMGAEGAGTPATVSVARGLRGMRGFIGPARMPRGASSGFTGRVPSQLENFMLTGKGLQLDPFQMARPQRIRMATRMGAVGGGLLAFSATGNLRRRHPTMTAGAGLGLGGYGLYRFLR